MKRRTDERILVAAMAAFGTRGYDGTSLDDLARELGIRKQTILYWFPSKEALLEAVVDRCADEVTARLVRGLERRRGRVRAGRGDGAGDVPAGRPPPDDARLHPGGHAARARPRPPACSAGSSRSIDRGVGVPRGGDGCRAHAAPRPAPAAPGRLLDGHRHGDGGRRAACLRRGAHPAVARCAAATSCSRCCGRRSSPDRMAAPGNRERLDDVYPSMSDALAGGRVGRLVGLVGGRCGPARRTTTAGQPSRVPMQRVGRRRRTRATPAPERRGWPGPPTR